MVNCVWVKIVQQSWNLTSQLAIAEVRFTWLDSYPIDIAYLVPTLFPLHRILLILCQNNIYGWNIGATWPHWRGNTSNPLHFQFKLSNMHSEALPVDRSIDRLHRTPQCNPISSPKWQSLQRLVVSPNGSNTYYQWGFRAGGSVDNYLVTKRS